MRRGPLFMVLASLLFTGMFALVKLVRVELGALDVIFWRGITATPLALLTAWGAGFHVRRPGLLAARALLGFGAMSMFVYAAKGLLIADLGLLYRLQPIAVAVIAPFFLGRAERAGASLWLVLALSLLGVALILAPGLAVGSVYGLAALAGCLFSALAHVSIRALMRSDDPRVVVLYLQFALLVLAPALLLVAEGRLPSVPSTSTIVPVLGIGVLSTGGQLLITYAYAIERAAVVAAASYSAILFSVLADIIIFAVLPGWTVWIGGTLIVAAGIWLVIERKPPVAPVEPAAQPPA